ncbi:uncharacterized protein CANTADRAFT_210513 [Suhomyces tanzawaensis NRRL Y-17324]|uniref:Ribosomal lysine N-methyltransferase 5 n=1 Tax=Suhomyces tanzawaensis NRRL Y-17324 TaxID=984487 RepID=A0A1E4SJR9_9ASCO|nr:uncharacterized protein CANTADRAFT_210513 [Suhomyces tanzawaensis NRRL Y-17324]ODV79753.1 hypothetical protein CANTADRAFT_210513 [Suhomyces tanzawaensis NRRL Y-17324]
MDVVDVTQLEQILDVEDHIYDLYTLRAPPEHQHLGYINRTHETLEISLKNGHDLTIKQSLTSLSSGKETSSTGFICWQASVHFVDWVLSHDRCPVHELFSQKPSLRVLELGSGIGAICASALAPLCKHYVATDQKHILKLLKHNFVENVASTCLASSTVELPEGPKKKQTGRVDVIEYDWEYPENGDFNLSAVGASAPDLIIACDTVYNEYLIPFFVGTVRRLLTEGAGAFIALQLRESDIMEAFVNEVLDQGLRLYCVPEALLSPELVLGFVVYYIAV